MDPIAVTSNVYTSTEETLTLWPLSFQVFPEQRSLSKSPPSESADNGLLNLDFDAVQKTVFDTLPNDLIYTIFSFLSLQTFSQLPRISKWSLVMSTKCLNEKFRNDEFTNSIILRIQNFTRYTFANLLGFPHFNLSCSANLPICHAIPNNYQWEVEFLLGDNRVNSIGFDKDLISKAFINNQKEIIVLLLTHPLIDSDSCHDIFLWAISLNERKLVNQLLKDSRLDPSCREDEAFRSACGVGHLDMVRLLLLDERINPAANENQGIQLACAEGYLEIVKVLLLDDRVDPSDDSNEAIFAACEMGHLAIVQELLLDERVDPSDNDNAAYSIAKKNNHTDVLKELLKDPRVTSKL